MRLLARLMLMGAIVWAAVFAVRALAPPRVPPFERNTLVGVCMELNSLNGACLRWVTPSIAEDMIHGTW